MNINPLLLQFVSGCDHQLLHFGENRFADLIEFVSFHRIMQVAFLHQILDIHFELGISRENLALSLDILHELHDGFPIFGNIASSR